MERKIGYKVTNPDMTCRGFQFELNKEFLHEGEMKVCRSGFHFCLMPQHCFNYYDFNSNNRVFEIEYDEIETDGDKSVTNKIKFIREIPWQEVLQICNTGSDNTGHSNSGNRNSGDSNSGNRNSGDRNSGNRNSGDSNSGNWNSGNRNSGDSNSGDSNSGNWNSGNRNSGDSNSGYRNSGAFCTDNNPVIWLFDKPTNINVKDWERSKAVDIMRNLESCIWIDESIMSKSEKENNPSYKTTGGYLKTISLKESWANLWGNLDEESKKVFTDLPNFDENKFEEITGIKVGK